MDFTLETGHQVSGADDSDTRNNPDQPGVGMIVASSSCALARNLWFFHTKGLLARVARI